MAYTTPKYGWKTPDEYDKVWYTEFCSMLSSMEQDVYAISMSGTTAVNENSAYWDSTHDTVSAGSGYWNSTHSTVSANSSVWEVGFPGTSPLVVWPWAYSSIGQGTYGMDIFMHDNYLYEDIWANGNSTIQANGDNINYNIYMAAGTYTLKMPTMKNIQGGIVDIDIDGVEVASFDLYSAIQAWTSVQTQAGIAITSNGLKTLKLRIDGTNGNPNPPIWAFYMYIAGPIVFFRTA